MGADTKRLLIVDGYNVAHSWPEILPLFDQGVDVVVERLTGCLKEIGDGRDLAVKVVFDGKGDATEARRPFAGEDFQLVFAPSSLTADAVIEQMVANSVDASSIYVASRDQAVVDAVEALGAQGVSPDELAGWLSSCRRTVRNRLKNSGDGAESSWGNRIPL